VRTRPSYKWYPSLATPLDNIPNGVRKCTCRYRGWKKVFKFVLRRATNTRRLTLEQRKPRMASFLVSTRRMLHIESYSEGKLISGLCPVYGYYPPNSRVNVDQVPLSFDETCALTLAVAGEKEVHVRSFGSAKRMCTLQVCMVAGPAGTPQPRISLCFRGQGKRLSKTETAFWEKHKSQLFVQWQKKAW